MDFEFTGSVEASFPADADRPKMRPTFMLTGIGVTWSTAPTTSESAELRLVLEGEVEMDLLIVSRDPSTDSLTSWMHLIAEGPIPLANSICARVLYDNTDAGTVKVLFIGYWR